jgi:hypothetical protein
LAKAAHPIVIGDRLPVRFTPARQIVFRIQNKMLELLMDVG